jgi:type IV secretion system protein VirD4
LPEDEARRLPLDEVIIVVDAQMPIRAKRIQYFDDRFFIAIHGAQKGDLPFPEKEIASTPLSEQAAAGPAAPVAKSESPMDRPVAGQEPMPEGGSAVGQQDEPQESNEGKSPNETDNVGANLDTDAASIGLANNLPERAQVKTSSRKAKTIAKATKDFEDRQGQLDLAEQQKLQFPDQVEATEENRIAMQDADDALSLMESEMGGEGQGGVSVSAA